MGKGSGGTTLLPAGAHPAAPGEGHEPAAGQGPAGQHTAPDQQQTAPEQQQTAPEAQPPQSDTAPTTPPTRLRRRTRAERNALTPRPGRSRPRASGPGTHLSSAGGPCTTTLHPHTHVRTDDARRLTGALALILGFMAVEVVAGILASSLALLSDAAHMLTDAGAIALALVAARLAQRPAAGRLHLRPPARRDPLGAAERRHSGRARRGDRARGRPPADRPARRRRRRGAGRGARRHRGEPRRHAWCSRAPSGAASTSRAPSSTCSRTCSRSSPRRGGRVMLITGFSRADGIAALIVAALMLRSGCGLLRDSGPRAARGRPARTSTPRRSAARSPPAARRRGARPARLGGHLRLPGAVRARDRARGLRHPGAPARAGGAAARALRRRRTRRSRWRTRHEGPLEIEPLTRAQGAEAL